MLVEAHSEPIVNFRETEDRLLNSLHNVFVLCEDLGVDARLVGSLGRSASLHQNPDTLATMGGIKDIDIVVLSKHTEESQLSQAIATAAYPFKYDWHFRGKIITLGDTTFLRYKDIMQPVDPTVFSKEIGSLYGLRVPTFNANTLFHLTALYGPMRAKDWQALYVFKHSMKKSHIHVMPEYLFEPFHALNNARRKVYPFDTTLGDIRYWYHQHIPYEKRTQLKGVVRFVRSYTTQLYGWTETPSDSQIHPHLK